MPHLRSKATAPDQWAALLAAELSHAERPAGEGWLTTAELAEKLGRSIWTARLRARAWHKRGLAEITYGSNRGGNRTMFVRPRP